jgi:FAD synthase
MMRRDSAVMGARWLPRQPRLMRRKSPVGVYWRCGTGGSRRSLVGISPGTRPTVNGRQSRCSSAAFDFPRRLTAHRAEFAAKLRDEVKFDSDAKWYANAN